MIMDSGEDRVAAFVQEHRRRLRVGDQRSCADRVRPIQSVAITALAVDCLVLQSRTPIIEH
jgi:hypothetical protein